MSAAFLLVNVSTGQVEYLSDAACALFLSGNPREIVQEETGTVRKEYSRKIIERMTEAFLPVKVDS